MLLQEVNPGSSEILRKAAGADWMVKAIDLRTPEPDDSPLRRRGVAIAGHGPLPRRRWLLPSDCWQPDQIRFPEWILLVETQTKGTPFCAASYHAPPGVTWGIVKPQQAIEADEGDAIKFYLETKGKWRSYSRDFNLMTVDPRRLSDDALRRATAEHATIDAQPVLEARAADERVACKRDRTCGFRSSG